MYIENTVARLAESLLKDPKETLKLNNMMCWDAVLYCLRKASNNRFYIKDHINLPTPPIYNNPAKAISQDKKVYEPKDLDEPLKVLFPGALQVMSPYIKSDCVVGICRKNSSDTPFFLSHVMISVGNGCCIGVNNACIGGSPGWSIVDLTNVFTWQNNNANPLYIAQYPPPPLALQERIILAKPVKELLTML
jgi:hypothetical protein